MGSYIDEFQDGREKQSDIVVTIDGPSGAGKGTLARQVAEKLDLPYYSAGDFFRSIAEERDMSVEELSEKADKQTDLEVDRRTLEKGLNESCVIESRIASWVLGENSDLKIYVTADADERAERIMSDAKDRTAEERAEDIEEARDRVEKRDEDNDQRYKDYYGIDTSEIDHYDLILDNTEMTVEEQRQMIGEVLEQRFPERTG